MTLILAPIVTVVAVGLAIAAMLRVRRNAPDGGYFNDGDRAAGVFGVLATGFAILLGFVVFLAFESYDQSRSGAETEAVVVTQQFKTAQFMPDAVGGDLADGLVCYGRSVVEQEWPRMDTAAVSEGFNPWGVELFQVLERADPKTATEQTAFDKWFDQTTEREQARSDRIHGAEGVIPTAVWVALAFMALLIFSFMLFFADSGERAKTQALLIGSVVSVVAATLLLLWFLDNPYHGGGGTLEPTAMERTQEILAQERLLVGSRTPLPCTETGEPR